MSEPTAGLAARRAALVALERIEVDEAWSTVVVPQAVADLPDPRDRAFASRLAYDTVRWEGSIDWLLEQFLTRRMGDVEPRLRRLLRLGVLQLWKLRVPAAAAVDTSVDLAREGLEGRRADRAAGFVNGVLRNVARANLDGKFPSADTDLVAHLGLVTAHPRWVVEERLERLAPERVASLLHADNEPAMTTLRALGDRDELVAELLAAGVDAHPTAEALQGVHVPNADPRDIEAVTMGRAVVQDEASMLVVEATRVRPGDTVLDLCAAPGGKTTDLAQRSGTTVKAVELHDHRAQLVRDAGERTGTSIDVVTGDARTVDLPGEMDVVLIDAPCTGLGIGRRRPEVRWRRSATDPLALASLQWELLQRGAALVRPGGHLTYSVCTWTHLETDEVADRLDASGGFEPVERRQLAPDSDGTDGMFVATWRRNDSATG